jgi:EF-hand domain pair
MFRNAEYVLALKDLMNLKGKVSLDEYKKAFDRLDVDGSGYIETSEVQTLFDQVYNDAAPFFEIEAFLKYFDQNNDGKISWEEFEHGLGAAYATQMEKGDSASRLLGQGLDDDDEEEDEEEEEIEINSQVYGE